MFSPAFHIHISRAAHLIVCSHRCVCVCIIPHICHRCLCKFFLSGVIFRCASISYQCLKYHKSLGLSLSLSLLPSLSWSLSPSFQVGQFFSPHHYEQMSELSQVSWVTLFHISFYGCQVVCSSLCSNMNVCEFTSLYDRSLRVFWWSNLEGILVGWQVCGLVCRQVGDKMSQVFVCQK